MRELKLKWLLIGALIDSTAMASVWPLTTIYMHQELHHSMVAAGIVLLLNSVASIIGSFIAGTLYDNHDSYKMILGGIILTWLAMVTLIFWNGWPIYPIMLIVIGFGTGWVATLSNSLGTTIRNHDGRYVFNMLYFMQNMGVMLGTMLVGLIFKKSVTPLFIISAIMFIGFFFVALFTYRIDPQVKQRQSVDTTDKDEKIKTKVPAVNQSIIMIFLVSVFVMWIFYQQWNSTVSLNMIQMGIPLRDYSFLWTINGLFILIVQGLMSMMGGKLFKDPYHQVYFGIIFVMISFVILVFSQQYWHFITAMIVLTVGEAIAFPSIPAIINTLSPYDQKGKYQGLASSFPSAGRAIGPLVGSTIAQVFSFVTLYAVGAVAILVVLAVMMFIIEKNKRKVTEYE